MSVRAYLRLDPELSDHKSDYPDGAFRAFIQLLCCAEQQPERGRFRNLSILRAYMGRSRRWISFLITRKDLLVMADGHLYVDGWDEWQEGDWKVKERVARIRNRRNSPGTVTPPVTVDVTPDVTVPDVNKHQFTAKAYSGKPLAVSGMREAVTGALEKSHGSDLSPEQVRVAIVLENLLGHQLAALDIQACGVWLQEFRYLDADAIIGRMSSHVTNCQEKHHRLPKTALGFHETLRLENDYRATHGAFQRTTSNGEMTQIGDVLARVAQ